MHVSQTFAQVYAGIVGITAASTAPRCVPTAFSCEHLSGIRVQDITAHSVRNFSASTVQNGDIPTANYTGLSFCNVTVSYTHPGKSDRLNVNVWLPSPDAWNGRFQGTGGGGYIAGYGPEALAPAVAKGYAAACTDGGHTSTDPAFWALIAPGELDHIALENFASVSINDLALIGKAVTEDFYRRPPKASYWSGCSTGGRQGFMLAQHYPTAFDGILALAPAINWPSFLVADYWPQQVMNDLDYFPEACELEFLTAAAVSACDELDGVQDGIVSIPDACGFDSRTLVGTSNGCNGTRTLVTWQAAEIAQASWTAPTNPSGEKLWPGFSRDAPLTGLPGGITVAETNCSTGTCTGAPFSVTEEWIRVFVEKDADFDTPSLTNAEYAEVFRRSIAEHQDVIGTADPDLSAFRKAGGKLLSWQGMADQLVPPNGTIQYYKQVLQQDSEAHDFFRLFLAPGTLHCAAGLGPFPSDSLDVLVEWVENDQTPDVLIATGANSNGSAVVRQLCPWPQVQMYVGGDASRPESFVCR